MDKHGYGHGDILIRPATIPAGAKAISNRVLAHGETGHAHALTADSDVEIFEREGTLFIRVGPKGGAIDHEEHGRHDLAPGDYRIGRQMEYDHFAEEAREVRD